MKIAIPTSDRESVFYRTGKAKDYAIFEIIDGSYESLGFRPNPHKEEGNYQENHNHQDLLELLKDCGAILVKGVGSQFKKEFNQAQIPIYITNETKVEEAIRAFTQDMLHHEHV